MAEASDFNLDGIRNCWCWQHPIWAQAASKTWGTRSLTRPSFATMGAATHGFAWQRTTRKITLASSREGQLLRSEEAPCQMEGTSSKGTTRGRQSSPSTPTGTEKEAARTNTWTTKATKERGLEACSDADDVLPVLAGLQDLDRLGLSVYPFYGDPFDGNPNVAYRYRSEDETLTVRIAIRRHIAHLSDAMPDALNGVPAIAAQIPLKKRTDPPHLSNILWALANLKDDAPEVLSIVPAMVPAMAVQIRLERKGLEPPMLGHKFVAKKRQVIHCRRNGRLISNRGWDVLYEKGVGQVKLCVRFFEVKWKQLTSGLEPGNL